MKTILAPNAPWPTWTPVPPRRSHHKKKRPTPSEVDAKFAEWVKKEFDQISKVRAATINKRNF